MIVNKRMIVRELWGIFLSKKLNERWSRPQSNFSTVVDTRCFQCPSASMSSDRYFVSINGSFEFQIHLKVLPIYIEMLRIKRGRTKLEQRYQSSNPQVGGFGPILLYKWAVGSFHWSRNLCQGGLGSIHPGQSTIFTSTIEEQNL